MGTTTSNDAEAMGPVPPAAGIPTQGKLSKTVAPTPARHSLPEEPLAVIRPGGGGGGLDLRELWAYRELLYFLVWRDVKVRYKQAALGLAWVVMQPLLTTLIFTVFLGSLARVPSDGLPYMVFVFVGLLPWTFFSAAVTSGSTSLVASSHLITKVYFPRAVVPAAAVGARLVDFAVAALILAGMMAYYRITPTPRLLLAVPLLALATLLALGVSMLTSALNVKYRDVGVATPVVVQLWMYVSPVLYPSSLVPAGWRRLYALNPLVGVVEGFRSAVFGLPLDWYAVAASAGFAAALFALASYLFRRVEREFADVI